MSQQSASVLQAHYDELMQQMPQLPLAILPASIMASLLRFDDSSSAAAAAAAAAHTRCSACGSPCSQLQPLLRPRLDWHARVVDVTSVRFVCGLCAAVSKPSLLLQLATPLAASHGPERAEQLQTLFLHLAAVNNAPASITSNADALAVWVQECAARAYSLSLTASSLRGWQLQPAHTSAAQLLKRYTPGSSDKQALKKKRQAAAAGVVSPPAQQVQQQGLPAVKRKKSVGGAAAAAASAGDEAPSTAKKQKRAAAAAATRRTPDHPVAPHSSKKSADKQQQQQQPSAAKTPKANGSKAAAGAAFKTPQPGKVAKSARKQHKQLLLSAPR